MLVANYAARSALQKGLHSVLGRHLEAGRGAQCSPAPAPRYPRGYPQRTQLRSDSRAHAYPRAHLSEPHMRTAPRPSTPAPSSDSALGNDRDTAAEGHAGGCAAASSRGLRAGAALLSRDMAPRRRARRGWKAGAPRFAPPTPAPGPLPVRRMPRLRRRLVPRGAAAALPAAGGA